MSTIDKINVGDMDWQEISHDGNVKFRAKRLGRALSASKLGTTLYQIPGGSSLWPYHYHHAQEEAMMVLSGKGSVRTPDGDMPLAPGDYVTFPVGPGGAHRVQAEKEMEVLIFSTMEDPDIAIYPDSGKVGVFGPFALDGTPGQEALRLFIRPEGIDYWEGEK